MMVVNIVVVPVGWVTQLLPLAVGKGGNERRAVTLSEPVGALKILEDDGAVPTGAVPVPEGGRVPERGPLGALTGVELVGARNPDEGRVPEGGPLGALRGTEPVGAGKPEEGGRLPDRGPLGALKGTEPEENGKPDGGREPLGAPDVKNELAPELRSAVLEERGPPDREPRELVNGGNLAVVSTGNDSVYVVVIACDRVDDPVAAGAEGLKLGVIVPLRDPLGALKGTEMELMPVGIEIEI